jgi:tRNA G10  N-methylase Trm11
MSWYSEGNRLKLKHPATYPNKLAEDLIRCFSVPEDVILDPFLGSGTTAVMASRYGRQFVGIDISEEYAEIARERLRIETTIEDGGLFSMDELPVTHTNHALSNISIRASDNIPALFELEAV